MKCFLFFIVLLKNVGSIDYYINSENGVDSLTECTLLSSPCRTIEYVILNYKPIDKIMKINLAGSTYDNSSLTLFCNDDINWLQLVGESRSLQIHLDSLYIKNCIFSLNKLTLSKSSAAPYTRTYNMLESTVIFEDVLFQSKHLQLTMVDCILNISNVEILNSTPHDVSFINNYEIVENTYSIISDLKVSGSFRPLLNFKQNNVSLNKIHINLNSVSANINYLARLVATEESSSFVINDVTIRNIKMTGSMVDIKSKSQTVGFTLKSLLIQNVFAHSLFAFDGKVIADLNNFAVRESNVHNYITMKNEASITGLNNIIIEDSITEGCSKGFYMKNALCLPCKKGYFQPENNYRKEECLACRPGSYSSAYAAEKCKLCSAGTFCERDGCEYCSKCYNEYLLSKPGSASCTRLSTFIIITSSVAAILIVSPLILLMMNIFRR